MEKNIDLTERTLALYQVNTVMSKRKGWESLRVGQLGKVTSEERTHPLQKSKPQRVGRFLILAGD